MLYSFYSNVGNITIQPWNTVKSGLVLRQDGQCCNQIDFSTTMLPVTALD